MACGCGVMWGHVPSMTRSSTAVAPHSSSLSAPSCAPSSRNRTHLSRARLTRVSSRAAWGPPAEGSRTVRRTRRRPPGRPPPLGGGRAAWPCRWRTRRAWACLLRLRRGLTARRSRPSRAATSRRGGTSSSSRRQRRLVRNCVRGWELTCGQLACFREGGQCAHTCGRVRVFRGFANKDVLLRLTPVPTV